MTTPSLTPALTSLLTQAASGPIGLTETDRTRIAAALTAAVAQSTHDLCDRAWQPWERWCLLRGIAALPADPAAICAYLAERAEAGAAADTLTTICSAIAYRHRIRGLADPTLHEAVRLVRRGLRRLVGTAPRCQARPLSTAEIRQIIDRIDRGTAKGARDAALILLGFASALRRSELAALTLADLQHQPGGLFITLRRSKTDQEAAGQSVGVAHGQHAATDPVAALAAWSACRGRTAGPLFTSMRNRHLTLEPLSGEAISRMLGRSHAAGLDATRITGHSLRAGHATTAAQAGVPLDRIAAQTRHKRIATLLERYIRPAQALR